nr:hypothetical protein [uncultured Flavobacterium sp.]
MNNHYIKFNRWAFNYYIERNSLETMCTLAVETSEVDNYSKANNNCDFIFTEINSKDWSLLLGEVIDDDIRYPKYFGLLALQCYAAAKMERDGVVSANNYKKRFREITGLSSDQLLETMFKETYKGIPIQEYIWEQARDFLNRKYKINISIPLVTKGAGRYVQYPKSQVVLNQEDLKEYLKFYLEVKNEFENISYFEFHKYYLNKINRYSNCFKRNNNRNNLFSPIENKIKLKQIFDFYCSENWRDLVIDEPASIANVDIKINTNYILTINHKVVKLYDYFFNEIIFSNSKFSNVSVGDFHSFKKSYEYPDEFNYVEKLELEFDYIFILNKRDLILNKKFSQNFEEINVDYGDVVIFKGFISEFTLSEVFSDRIVETFPITLKGIKVSRKAEYLASQGPEIINNKNIPISIYWNNQRLHTYEKKNAQIGSYSIRIPGYSYVKFKIIDNPTIQGVVDEFKYGWELGSFTIQENNFNIQGLFLKDNENECNTPLTINTWIKLQKDKAKIKSTKNLILKVLSKCKY